MSTTKEDRNFKTLINRETTSSDAKFYFNELGAETININANDLWSSVIPFNDPSQAVIDDIAELKTLFVLTEDLTVSNSQSWKAEQPVGTRLRDWISPKYGDNFEIKLFDNNDTQIFTTDSTDWFFDYQTGILTFNGNATSKIRPFKITGYRYIGPKGFIGSTIEDLVFPVDYNDGTAVDPVLGITFYRQSDIDDYLANNGTSNFKHLHLVFATVPILVNHTITFELAAGVHRPDPSAHYNRQVWQWIHSDLGGVGTFHIVGAPPPQYTAVTANETVTGYSNTNKDPYINFAGGTYPNDGSLIGLYAVISTGQLTLIHDHTDSRLYVTNQLSPDPTGAIVVVGRPSTILRNSMDDIVKLSNYGLLSIDAHTNYNNYFSTIEDITFEPFNHLGTTIGILSIYVGIQRVLIDDITYPAANINISSYDGGIACTHFSHQAALGATAGITVFNTPYTSMDSCVIMGGRYGVELSNASLTIYQSVLIEVGGVIQEWPAIMIDEGSNLIAYAQWPGKKNEIRAAPFAGVAFRAGGGMGDTRFNGIVFKDNPGPCVRLIDNANFNHTKNDNAARAFTDGGGNTDVGIEFAGSQCLARLNQYATLSGSVGDVRLSNGNIVSFVDILALGPYIDGGNNFISKVP
jgi:hypothetical protein